MGREPPVTPPSSSNALSLKTVPTPSFWERTRRGRINVYVWLIIGSVWLGGAIATMAAMELVRAFLR
jgi:hypothetical protein